MKMKRGLSPVIASVLMILLVIVLVIIIFSWGRGFIGEHVEKFGKPMDDYCKSVDFDVVVIDNTGSSSSLEIVNRGNIGIGAFDFKVYSGGDSKVARVNTGVPAFGSLDIDVDLGGLFNKNIESVEVFPVLRGNVAGESSHGGFFVCENNPVQLNDLN